MPSVTTREYNPTTGTLIGNISSLNFGKIVVGTHTPVKILDFAFSGVTTVSNIKLGITSSTLDVNNDPDDIQSDGSSSNGRFGAMHTNTFDTTLSTGTLGRHFAGLNTTGLASDEKNIEIGNRSTTLSQFVYLDIELGSDDLGVASGVYRIFFDFE
jgi:hypothetical protein